MTALRITARRAGFRRAGVAHPAAAVEHPDGSFTPEQIEALISEPMLIVEVVTRQHSATPGTDHPAPAATGPKSPRGKAK